MIFAGDVEVQGNVSPEHILEDLRIKIPYRGKVRIPHMDANRSSDLEQALRSGKVSHLSTHRKPALPTGVPPAYNLTDLHRRKALKKSLVGSSDSNISPTVERTELEKENEFLRRELEEARISNSGLGEAMKEVTQQLSGIQAALTNLKVQGTVTSAPGSTSVKGFDGGAPAVFLPNHDLSTVKSSNPNVKTKTSEADVKGARDALRALRQQEGNQAEK